ncbi:hypothetical protein TNCV_4324121 [Trichonephila clavipes]|nr:hypothetical protein TNCV_4324121 [Trichonephila clavipes]
MEPGYLEALKRHRISAFFHVVQDRSKDTLLTSIKSNMKESTIVISDCWKAYDCLEDEDFILLSVNHSMFFKDPDTGALIRTPSRVCVSAIKRSLRGTRSYAMAIDDGLSNSETWLSDKDDTSVCDLVFTPCQREDIEPLSKVRSSVAKDMVQLMDLYVNTA